MLSPKYSIYGPSPNFSRRNSFSKSSKEIKNAVAFSPPPFSRMYLKQLFLGILKSIGIGISLHLALNEIIYLYTIDNEFVNDNTEYVLQFEMEVLNMPEIVLITGPVMSGKRYEVIKLLQLWERERKEFVCFQSTRNNRGGFRITSPKNDVVFTANGIETLLAISNFLNDQTHGFVIDGVHMFDYDQFEYFKYLYDKNKYNMLLSGLLSDFRGELFPIMREIMLLNIDCSINLKTDCVVCGGSFIAEHTQAFDQEGKPVISKQLLSKLEDSIEEFNLKPVCADCFIRE